MMASRPVCRRLFERADELENLPPPLSPIVHPFAVNGEHIASFAEAMQETYVADESGSDVETLNPDQQAQETIRTRLLYADFERILRDFPVRKFPTVNMSHARLSRFRSWLQCRADDVTKELSLATTMTEGCTRTRNAAEITLNRLETLPVPDTQWTSNTWADWLVHDCDYLWNPNKVWPVNDEDMDFEIARDALVEFFEQEVIEAVEGSLAPRLYSHQAAHKLNVIATLLSLVNHKALFVNRVAVKRFAATPRGNRVRAPTPPDAPRRQVRRGPLRSVRR